MALLPLVRLLWSPSPSTFFGTQGTSTHHAHSASLSADGTHLELQLPTLITPVVAHKANASATLYSNTTLSSTLPKWISPTGSVSLPISRQLPEL